MIPWLRQDHPLSREPAFPITVPAESERDSSVVCVAPGGVGGSSPAHGPSGCYGMTIFSFFPFLNATEEKKSGAIWSALSGGRPRGVPPKARSAAGRHAWELQLLCKKQGGHWELVCRWTHAGWDVTS